MSSRRPRALPGADAVSDQRALRAFIYNRNSRGKNAGSPDDTNLENHRLCEARGWSVAGVFFDRGISASRHSTKARDDWDRMLAGVRGGQCDVIVYWEFSRATRNTRTYLDLRDLCEQSGVLLCYNGRVYDMRNRSDRFVTHMDAMRAEDEADGTTERNRRTTRINAERGRPHGRTAYGFRREYDPETGKLLRQVPDEAQAPIVVEMTARVAAGHTDMSIARDLKARGVEGPCGEWSGSTVREVVLHPANIGLRVFQGEVIGKAAWDAIVADDVYYAACKRLRDPSRLTHHDNAVKYLMSGVGLCGSCLRDPEPVERTVKSTVRGQYTCGVCARGSIKREWFDETVEATLLEYVSRPEFAASLMAVDGDGVAAALAEAEALEGQLQEARGLASAFRNGRFALSATSLAVLEQELLPRIEAARGRAADLTVPPVVRRLAQPGAWTLWHEELDLAEKRAAIRSVVKVSLFPPGRGAWKPRPEWFGWDWLR